MTSRCDLPVTAWRMNGHGRSVHFQLLMEAAAGESQLFKVHRLHPRSQLINYFWFERKVAETLTQFEAFWARSGSWRGGGC